MNVTEQAQQHKIIENKFAQEEKIQVAFGTRKIFRTVRSQVSSIVHIMIQEKHAISTFYTVTSAI